MRRRLKIVRKKVKEYSTEDDDADVNEKYSGFFCLFEITLFSMYSVLYYVVLFTVMAPVVVVHSLY